MVEPQIFFVNATGKNVGCFCLSISRDVRTKRQSASAAYLAMRFTSENLFVRKNEVKKRKKSLPKKIMKKITKQWRVFTQRKDSKSYLLVVDFVYLFILQLI